MAKNEKLEKGFQDFIDWYMAPIKLVERPLWLLWKFQEMEAPADWKYEKRLLWHLWRVLKVFYFFLLFIPLFAIWYCVYFFSWFWPVFFGGILEILIKRITEHL
jgi:hypothetical protein